MEELIWSKRQKFSKDVVEQLSIIREYIIKSWSHMGQSENKNLTKATDLANKLIDSKKIQEWEVATFCLEVWLTGETGYDYTNGAGKKKLTLSQVNVMLELNALGYKQGTLRPGIYKTK